MRRGVLGAGLLLAVAVLVGAEFKGENTDPITCGSVIKVAGGGDGRDDSQPGS